MDIEKYNSILQFLESNDIEKHNKLRDSYSLYTSGILTEEEMNSILNGMIEFSKEILIPTSNSLPLSGISIQVDDIIDLVGSNFKERGDRWELFNSKGDSKIFIPKDMDINEFNEIKILFN